MCLIALVVTVAYVGVATWLVSRYQSTATRALKLAAACQEHAALAKAQLEQVQQARRTLPEPIRSVALSYAAKVKMRGRR